MASKYAQPSPPDTDSGLDTVQKISGKRLKDQTIDFYEHFSCISIYCQIYIRNWNGTDQKGNQYHTNYQLISIQNPKKNTNLV